MLLILLFFAFNFSCLAAETHEGDKLVGWLGETYKAADRKGSDESGMVVLSWQPRIFLYRKFLTDEECDELISLAKPRLTRSGVSDSTTGAGKLSDIRTSSGMFFGRQETPTIGRIEDRIAQFTMTEPDQGEGIQVLRYDKTQRYDPHHDFFSHEHADENGGNRLVTGLMYLTDVQEGGETVFPKVPVPKNQTRKDYSECAMKGLAYKPRKGDIVVFWSIRTDGVFEPKSLHGSCPVIKGQKWSATKWIHIGHLGQFGMGGGLVKRVIYAPPPPPDVPGCVNRHKLCNHWAESGECQENPTYMIGNQGKPGDCIKACNRCDLGPNEVPGQAQAG